MLRVLRMRDFRLLWVARLNATLAAGLLVVAVPAHMYAVTGSALATGLTLAVEYLPVLVLGPFAGVVADRWDRRRLMAGTDLVRVPVVCLLLFARTPETVWLVYPAVLAEGAAATLFRPAAQAHTPAVVGTGPALTGANALNAVTSGTVGLVAAPLGAALFAAFGIGAVVTASAAGYLASATAIAFTRPYSRDRGPCRRVPAELRDGLSHLRRSPVARALLAAGGVYLAANAALTAMLVPFGVTYLGGGTNVGWLLSALSAGFLLGAPISRRIVERFSARTAIGCGQILVAGAFCVMFNARSMPVALIAAFLLGIPGVTVLVAVQTWVQRTSPAALLGRVSAAFLTVEAAATVLGAFAGPALSELAGPPVALNAACATTLAAAVLTFCLVPGSLSRPSSTVAHGDRKMTESVRRPARSDGST
ncbi:MFS transporter [Planobispora takensis]|uniref:MFS transporter n=1 Tax=Planobispora takensis TaxID=1367882 RepID=A0A8J3WVY3_9ACTN|nr:MFS transporter [Planobispora takensis]GII03550.1 MFS transporter [Planobispora takensis]